LAPGALAPLAGARAGRPATAVLASAARTEPTDTPSSSAIAACVAPPWRRARASATSSGPTFEGPFGPRWPGTSPSAPLWSHARHQRRRQSVLTQKPAATSTALAAPVDTRFTAARRRLTRSPVDYQPIAIPQTNTAPPSSSSNNAAAGPSCTDPAGRNGNGWPFRTATIPARPTTPEAPVLATNQFSNILTWEWWTEPFIYNGFSPPMSRYLDSPTPCISGLRP